MKINVFSGIYSLNLYYLYTFKEYCYRFYNSIKDNKKSHHKPNIISNINNNNYSKTVQFNI